MASMLAEVPERDLRCDSAQAAAKERTFQRVEQVERAYDV